MTPAAADDQGLDDAWTRFVTGWHVAFALMLVLAGVQLFAISDLEPRHQALALGALAVLALAYLLVRRGPGHVSRAAALTYLLIAIAVAAVTCWLNPFGLLLFLVYPHIWVYSGDHGRQAVVLTLLLTLAAGVGFVAAAGWSADSVRDTAPSMLISLCFSLLLGLWITRIIEQSTERAELIAELRAARAQLADAHHAQGVMAERERMAREIHDTLAQGFTSVVMQAQVASAALRRDPDAAEARLGEIEAVARENLAEARALVAAFSPVALDGATLADAVRRLAERFGAETGLDVDVDVVGDISALGRDREVVLLRAAQEALTNVRRHARAHAVTVRLVADGDGARVMVGDDGVGFAPAVPTEGFGLAGMRGRVHEVGGDVDVASTPGRGTRVTVRVPLLEAAS